MYSSGMENDSSLGEYSLTPGSTTLGPTTWRYTKLPDMDQNRSELYRHPEVSREIVEKILLILHENQRDPLLELVAAVSRWMFSVPDHSGCFDSFIYD